MYGKYKHTVDPKGRLFVPGEGALAHGLHIGQVRGLNAAHIKHTFAHNRSIDRHLGQILTPLKGAAADGGDAGRG